MKDTLLIILAITFTFVFAAASAGEHVPTTISYHVKRGQTLSEIANLFRISESDLFAANPAITDPNLVFSGQVILIPLPGLSRQAGDVSSYRVRRGDSLARIALWFRTTAPKLAAFNGIADPNSILAGDVIRVPSTSNAAATAPLENVKVRQISVGSKATPPLPKKQALAIPAVYSVGTGETLAMIATANGLTVADLKTHNPAFTDMDPNTPMPVGSQLTVPYQPLIFTE